MKVSAEHLSVIAAAIGPLDTPERRACYLGGDFPRADVVRDLGKRYRWDLYWSAVRAGHSLPDSTDGYNDAHIDTALRHILGNDAPWTKTNQEATPA